MYRFRDTASYLSKFANLDLPHLHLAPPLGVTPFEFQKDFWHQKTRVPGLSCLCVPMFSHFSTTLTCDRRTNRQTDTQTQGQSIYRASIASRGKNTCKCLQNRQRFSILIQRNISNTLKVCPGKNVQPTTKLHIISPTILVHNPFLLSHVDNMLRQNLGYSNPESKVRKILALQQRQCKQTENCSWHQHLSACSIQFVCQHLQKSQEDKTHPQPFSLCPN